MANSKDTPEPLYYLSATDAQGRGMVSWSQDASRWSNSAKGEESFLDRSSLICALDAAQKEKFTNVRVRPVLIGDELTHEEIDLLCKEENVASRKIARDELIAEKGLSSEQVALLTEA